MERFRDWSTNIRGKSGAFGTFLNSLRLLFTVLTIFDLNSKVSLMLQYLFWALENDALGVDFVRADNVELCSIAANIVKAM